MASQPTITGSVTDPDFRHQRAKIAGRARTTPSYHVQKVIDAAGELTDGDMEKLRSLLNLPCRCDHHQAEAATA